MTGEIAAYEWFDQYEPLCFSIVVGVAEDEAIRRFGGDPATSATHGPEHYWELMDDGFVSLLQVGTAGPGAVFAIEVNGYTGINALPSLSRDGARAFVAYTHVNGADRTGYAVDGRVVVDEEPWGPLTPLSDPDPAWNPAWCDGLTDVEHDVWLRGARQLALAERVTGVPIDQRWFEMPLRTVLLPDPEDNPVTGIA